MPDTSKPRTTAKRYVLHPSEHQKNRSKLNQQPEPEAVAETPDPVPAPVEKVVPRRERMKRSGQPHQR